MTPKEKFDAYMRLAEFGAGRWNARRQYEWRNVYAIWAFLIGLILYVEAQEFPALFGIILIFVQAIFTRSRARRNQTETKLMWNAARAADKVLGEQNVIPPESEWPQPFIKSPSFQKHLGFIFGHGHAFQLLTSGLLIVIFYVLRVEHTTWWAFSGVSIAR